MLLRLGELQQYKEEHGDIVPKVHKANKKLGNWVNLIRHHYMLCKEGESESQLCSACVGALERVGFTYPVPTRDGKMWHINCYALKTALQEHSNGPMQPSLRKWVHWQRVQWSLNQEGKKSTLTPLRIAALDEINFVWETKSSWMSRYEGLLEYKAQHGDCNVPQDYENDVGLGRWVTTQVSIEDDIVFLIYLYDS